MAPSSVLLALLQICSLHLLAVAMPTKCHLPGHVVQKTHLQLKEMGGDFPQRCQSFNGIISFPDSLLPAANHSQCRQTLEVVYESLRGSDLVFMEYYSPERMDGVTWVENKVEQFLTLQNRLMGDGRCLSSVGSSDALSSYFGNVTAVIEQQESCGWEVLRSDVLWVLKTALQRHHHCFKW